MMGEWKEYKLGDVCSRLSSGKNIRAEFVKDSGLYPVYGGNGLRGYTDNFNFEGECGIIGRQGAYCGNVRFFKGKGYMTEHAVVVQGNEFADTYYLSSLLSTMHLERLSGQSAQPGLAVGTLSVQNIVLPDISIQNKIVAILSSLDAKIENNNKINANLEAQAQALFKSWFVDFEPFQDGEFEDSELGRIPKGWEVGTLESLCSFISRGLSPKYNNDTDQWVLGQTCVRNNIVSMNNARKHILKSQTEKKVKQWDVLINSTGIGSLGRVGIIYFNSDNVAFDSHLTVVRAENPIYKFYIGRNLLNRQLEIENMAVGSTGQTELPRESVKQMRILIPSEEVLSHFNSLLEPIGLLMYGNLDENKSLSTLRDTLLPKLMSGEIEV